MKLKQGRRNGLTEGKRGSIATKENEKLSSVLACCRSHMVKGWKEEKLGLVYPAGQGRAAGKR